MCGARTHTHAHTHTHARYLCARILQAVWSHILTWCDCATMCMVAEASRKFRAVALLPGSCASVSFDALNDAGIADERFIHLFPEALRSASRVALYSRDNDFSLGVLASYACRPGAPSASKETADDDAATKDRGDGAVSIVVPLHSRANRVLCGGGEKPVRMRPNTALRDLALTSDFLETGTDCDALPRLFPNLTRLELCLRSYDRAESRSKSMVDALPHLRALEVVRFVQSTDDEDDDDDDAVLARVLSSDPHPRSLPPTVVSFTVRRSDHNTEGDTDAALDVAEVRRPNAEMTGRAARVLLQLCAAKNARLETLALTDPRAARLARPLSQLRGAAWPPLRSLSLSQNALCRGVRLHTLLCVPTLECLTLSRMDLRGEEVDGGGGGGGGGGADALGSSFSAGSSASASTRAVAADSQVSAASGAALREATGGAALREATVATKAAMRHVEIDQCLFTDAWLRRILEMYTALVTLHLSGPPATADPEPAPRKDQPQKRENDGDWLLESVARSAAVRDGHLRYLQIASVTGANPPAFAPPNAARPSAASPAPKKSSGAGSRKILLPSPSLSPPLSRTIPIVFPAPRIVPDPNRSRCSCQSTCDNCICVRTRVACDDKCHRYVRVWLCARLFFFFLWCKRHTEYSSPRRLRTAVLLFCSLPLPSNR